MKDYLEAERQDLRRRRRERYLIIFLGVVISSLIYLGMRIFHLGQTLPFSSSIFAFALINICLLYTSDAADE